MIFQTGDKNNRNITRQLGNYLKYGKEKNANTWLNLVQCRKYVPCSNTTWALRLQLTLAVLRLLYLRHKTAKIFENNLNPIMMVFIGKLLPSTIRWVPMCQWFSWIPSFLQFFLHLATSSESANGNYMLEPFRHRSDVYIYLGNGIGCVCSFSIISY